MCKQAQKGREPARSDLDWPVNPCRIPAHDKPAVRSHAERRRPLTFTYAKPRGGTIVRT